MNDDYLWDGSGPADPVVARLEQALAPLRHRSRPLAVVAAEGASLPAAWDAARPRSPWWLAGALGVAFAAAAGVTIVQTRDAHEAHPAVAGRGGSVRLEPATSAGGIAGFGGAGGYGGS